MCIWHMVRSTDAQKAERLNAAHSLLARGTSMAEAVALLSRQFGISRRQAYRYVQEAQAIGHAVAIVAPSVPITLKMPANVGARCAGVLRNQWLDDQRDRDASDRDLSLSCTRAWLSEDDIGIATKSDSIIRLTACLAANFSKFTNSWFPTRFELSASVPG
jgi:hypothetical protein